MFMSADSYAKAISYEMFIRKAHSCDRGARNGADVAYMKNLIDTENGQKWVKESYEKQFEKVKNYLHKAFAKLLKNKKLKNVHEDLLALKEGIDTANNSNKLVKIVNKGLDLSLPLLDSMLDE
jgi:hypothetical protein